MTKKDLTSETAPDTFNVEAEARRRGIEPYQVRAVGAVNDQLVRDLAADFRRGASAPASMAARPQSSEPEPVKGNGWQDATPLKGVDTRWVDAQLDAADRRDRNARLREAAETAWIESHFEKGPRIDQDYNPLSKENLEK